jgi:FtsZ-interacting cell division protein ZipA
MSELQAVLLAIGFGVIVAVYVFGWWQQRRYRRKFGAAFKAGHADALYHGRGEKPQDLQTRESPATGGNPAAISSFDEPCELLDVRSDFIIELHMKEGVHATVLDGFWQRKFDFGKPVHVCGMAVNSAQWERTIAESQTLYARFRIALQLVDRSGAISAAKLADFSDLVLGVAKQIRADVSAPDAHEAYHRAVEQDEFCAEVDQMVGINLVPPGDRLLQGSRIAQAAALFGMKLESDGAFHLPDTRGWQGADRRRAARVQENDRRRAWQSLFSLVNLNNEPFQHNTLETATTWGVTLLLDLPRVENPVQQFDQMLRVARELAGELQADLVDDHRVQLSEAGLARIRGKVAEVEAKMRDHGIVPGSAQARRLFS